MIRRRTRPLSIALGLALALAAWSAYLAVRVSLTASLLETLTVQVVVQRTADADPPAAGAPRYSEAVSQAAWEMRRDTQALVVSTGALLVVLAIAPWLRRREARATPG